MAGGVISTTSATLQRTAIQAAIPESERLRRRLPGRRWVMRHTTYVFLVSTRLGHLTDLGT